MECTGRDSVGVGINRTVSRAWTLLLKRARVRTQGSHLSRKVETESSTGACACVDARSIRENMRKRDHGLGTSSNVGNISDNIDDPGMQQVPTQKQLSEKNCSKLVGSGSTAATMQKV